MHGFALLAMLTCWMSFVNY